MFLPVSLSVPVGKLKALKADDTPLSRFAAALGGVALTQRLPTTFGSASRHASPACVDCILAIGEREIRRDEREQARREKSGEAREIRRGGRDQARRE